MSLDQSACGCTWERKKGWGDVVVAQCVKHAAASKPKKAKIAMAAADRAEAEFRRRRGR